MCKNVYICTQFTRNMMVSAHISDDEQFSLKAYLFQVTSSLNSSREARISKKKHKAKVAEENQKRSFMDDLIYNPSTRKLFFDFFTKLIKQESSSLLEYATKESAMIYCEALESAVIGKFEEMKDLASQAEFETLDEFYAYASAIELVDTIESFYNDMKEVAVNCEDEKFEKFMSEQIEDCLEKNPRIRIRDTKSFLDNL